MFANARHGAHDFCRRCSVGVRDDITMAMADAFLTKRGLILRQVGAYKLPNALRMSVGTEEANHLVVQALKEFLGSRT